MTGSDPCINTALPCDGLLPVISTFDIVDKELFTIRIPPALSEELPFITEFVNKRNFDGHIVITDMMAPKPIRSTCQRMWLTDSYGGRCSYFKPAGERVLVLD